MSKKSIPAPKPFDKDYKAQDDDDKVVSIINLSNNIIELPIKDASGKYLVLGARCDAGLIGSTPNEAETKLGLLRRARLNPAFDLFFKGNSPLLEMRAQRVIFEL